VRYKEYFDSLNRKHVAPRAHRVPTLKHGYLLSKHARVDKRLLPMRL